MMSEEKRFIQVHIMKQFINFVCAIPYVKLFIREWYKQQNVYPYHTQIFSGTVTDHCMSKWLVPCFFSVIIMTCGLVCELVSRTTCNSIHVWQTTESFLTILDDWLPVFCVRIICIICTIIEHFCMQRCKYTRNPWTVHTKLRTLPIELCRRPDTWTRYIWV